MKDKMACKTCGHHAADHKWAAESKCLKADCRCQKVR